VDDPELSEWTVIATRPQWQYLHSSPICLITGRRAVACGVGGFVDLTAHYVYGVSGRPGLATGRVMSGSCERAVWPAMRAVDDDDDVAGGPIVRPYKQSCDILV